MTDKNKPAPKQSIPQLSEDEAAKVKGGNMPRVGGVGGIGTSGTLMDSPESCKATTDTGMMGCVG